MYTARYRRLDLARFLLHIIDATAFKEFVMKKIVVVLTVLAVLASGLYANGRGELTTVEGVLAVRESVPFIKAEDGEWLLPPGPFYRVAWEESISVGDKLVVRGYVDTDPRFAPEGFSGRVMPVSATVNGKELEFGDSFGPGPGPGRGSRLRRDGRGGNDCGEPFDGHRFDSSDRFDGRRRNR